MTTVVRKKESTKQRRSFPRTACFIPVDFAVKDRVYRDFIQNLSESGAFINSRASLNVGEEILMTFSWVDFHSPIKSKGKIVRTESRGFGVKFENPLALVHV